MRLHDDTVRLVKERAKILDAFDNENLKKSGSEFVTHCPWHDDQKPSLAISVKKNFAYCPVCCRHEDPIGWIMDRQGLSFSDAVQQLAKRYNVEIKAADPEDHERFQQENAERARLYKEREKEETTFSDALFECEEAKNYFKSRGVNRDSAIKWGLGWDEQLRRVVFPLRDQKGRTIAFTKRTIDEGVKPKYKNSFNDLLFKKSKLIYGLDLARDSIVSSGSVVIVEGQMDVIMLSQNGVGNVVAVSGSNLTGDMVQELTRSTRLNEVVLCFDGDQGGELAQERAVTRLQALALSGEIGLKILVCPRSTDPADNAERFNELLGSAVSWVEFMFERAISQLDLSDPLTVSKAEKGVRDILQRLPEGAMRSWVQNRAKEVLNVVPKTEAAIVLTRKQQDRCDWFEKRAVRLMLFSDRQDHLEAIQACQINGAETQQLLTVCISLWGLPPSQRKLQVSKLAKQIDVLYDVLRPLLKPIGEVYRRLTEHPEAELEEIFPVLMEECCAEGNPKLASGES